VVVKRYDDMAKLWQLIQQSNGDCLGDILGALQAKEEFAVRRESLLSGYQGKGIETIETHSAAGEGGSMHTGLYNLVTQVSRGCSYDDGLW
jgi:hypothetical protein